MPLSQKARAAIDEFGRSPGVTGEHHENLLDLIEYSPLLAEKFNELVDKQGLRIVPANDRHPQTGYSRQYQELHLDPRMLTSRFDRASYFKRIGFLGYELQRALDADQRITKLTRIEEKVRRIAKSGGREHDGPRSRFARIKDRVKRVVRPGHHERNYTRAVKEHINTRRSYRAMAEIGRWNAIVSALHKENGNPELKPADLKAKQTRWYRHFEVAGNQLPSDFKYAGSVVRDDHLFVPMSERNIRAVAHNLASGDHAVNSAYTNRGHLGCLTRPEAYAADMVGYIARCERSRHPTYDETSLPKVRIDAVALGINPDTLAKHAHNEDRNSDAVARLRYLDKSDGMPVCRDFDPSQGLDRSRPLKLIDEGHPDHALYREALDKVRALEVTLPAFAYPNLAAALLVKAREEGIRIDAIHAGSKIICAEQDPGRPRRRAMAMDFAKAVDTHVDVSCRRWDELAQQQRLPVQPELQPAQANRRPWDEVMRELERATTQKGQPPLLPQGQSVRGP